VCHECRLDPFKMEEARKRAAKLGNEEVFEQLYGPNYAFLHQGRVDLLWNDFLGHQKDQTLDFTVWRNKKSVGLIPRGVKRVLEVGFGMGHAVRYLLRRFKHVEIYGTDISSEAVHYARTQFKGTFAVANLGESPWPELKFDAIVMLEVLEHIEVPRTLQVLRWLHSLLTPAGRLILSVPLERVADLRRSYSICPHCGQLVHQIGHVRSYSELQPVRMELALAGFQVERTLGIAGGKYYGIPRQWLMPLFPSRVRPMVMVLSCHKQ